MAALGFAVVLAACSSSSSTATTLATSSTAAAPTTVATTTAGRVPEGFPSTAIRITPAGGTPAEWCVLLAADAALRGRGLMEVDSLGRYDGMLFDFGGPSNGEFYMLRTRIPLTVGFFDAGGAFVSSADMEPCPDDDNDPLCPTYGAEDFYNLALEVPQGGLSRLGVGPGSSIEDLGRAC